MIQSIIVIFGIVCFIDALFKKWKVWEMISQVGSKTNSKFIYKLSQCEFCLKFHISVLVTMLYCVFYGFFLYMTIVPVVVGGVTYISNKNGL